MIFDHNKQVIYTLDIYILGLKTAFDIDIWSLWISFDIDILGFDKWAYYYGDKFGDFFFETPGHTGLSPPSMYSIFHKVFYYFLNFPFSRVTRFGGLAPFWQFSEAFGDNFFAQNQSQKSFFIPSDGSAHLITVQLICNTKSYMTV